MKPSEIMESALFVLETGGNYKVAYDAFLGLYRTGELREDAMSALTQAFYEPNEEELRGRYQKNRALLTEYPYLFRKDFPAFEDLPVRFFPYDDEGYLPFDRAGERFGDYFAPRRAVISRNFFRNLDRPILAADVYSQYELEYLRDNVRRSEDVARENHLYLHYTDWGTFCAWLQVLDMAPVLSEEKVVFLIGEEIEQYPIDFQARFGIDYAKCTPRPVGLREVTRLIWHSQLSSHNGGDFFNEVFDSHPNLMIFPGSVMIDELTETMKALRGALTSGMSLEELQKGYEVLHVPEVIRELYSLPDLTDKDLMVACYMVQAARNPVLDNNSRIVPAVFFQPHFYDVHVAVERTDSGKLAVRAAENEMLLDSPMVQGFKYIKTFTPLRRVTTSYAATLKFMYSTVPLTMLMGAELKDAQNSPRIDDSNVTVKRMLNHTYLVDREDRLYTDCILVRFEDAKLNPKATFSALCAFLDLPYTESMMTCTEEGTPTELGFNTSRVYETYPLFSGSAELFFYEYIFRNVYCTYGYDFHFYDGSQFTQAEAKEFTSHFFATEYYMRELRRRLYTEIKRAKGLPSPEVLTAEELKQIDDEVVAQREMRFQTASLLLSRPEFISPRGRPLEMMPMLRLDEDLLEQPLYH